MTICAYCVSNTATIMDAGTGYCTKCYLLKHPEAKVRNKEIAEGKHVPLNKPVIVKKVKETKKTKKHKNNQ